MFLTLMYLISVKVDARVSDKRQNKDEKDIEHKPAKKLKVRTLYPFSKSFDLKICLSIA